MRRFDSLLGAIAVFVIIALAIAFTARANEPAKVELLKTEVDATSWAFVALLSYPDPTYIRFVEIPPYGDPEWIGALDVAVNMACSQTPILHRGDRHAGGWLIAYDLQKMAPDPEQLKRLVSVWDSLAVRDSRYHLSEVNIENNKGTTAFLAPHLQEALARHATDPNKSERVDVLIARLTNSPGAIYPADFLIEQLLTSVVGKYPEFRQMDFERKGKDGTAVVRFVNGGFFFGESRDRFGEKGALLLASSLSGKGRVISSVYGTASRMPLVITFDPKDSNIRPENQFIRNLIKFKFDAGEAFIPMSNGFLESVLFNSEFDLQRVAPPDIVCDYTKPDGFTKELEMGMSCVMCHMTDKRGWYKTDRNDMEFLLGADVDYFGDEIEFNGKMLTRAEAVAIVVGKYSERLHDPDGVLARAQRDVVHAVDILTDYDVVANGPTSVERVGLKIKQIYHGYRFRLINADQACLELGVRVPEGQGVKVLRQLVPRSADGKQEDIVISLLRNGALIPRDRFSEIYPEMARRAVSTRALLTE